MFIVYGIFALVTNIIASKDYHSIANQNYLILSMGSKQLNPTDKNEKLVFIQAWIGFIMVIIWGFVFYYLQKTQR
jgi:predicted membrane protein